MSTGPEFGVVPRHSARASWNLTTMTGALVLQIWDEQAGALLADGLGGMEEATARLEELLAETRRLVESSGDSVEGMWLSWTIRDRDGRVVAGHEGAPVPWPT